MDTTQTSSLQIRHPISFREVEESDFEFLYKLYLSRDNSVKLVSKIPSREESDRFNRANPYKIDKIILHNGALIGRVLVDVDNSVGVDIVQEFRGLGYGRIAINKVLELAGPGSYLANINPENKVSIAFFQAMGFKQDKFIFNLSSRQSKLVFKKEIKKEIDVK